MVKIPKFKIPKFLKSKKFIAIVVLVVIAFLVFYAVGYVFESYGQVGDRGRDMLRAVPYFGISYEIDYMPGYAPNPAALDALSGFVQKYSGKAVSFTLTEIPSQKSPTTGQPCILQPCPIGATYSGDDLVTITLHYRDVFPIPGYLSVYILYLDGSIESPGVGGASWCATCIAVSGFAIHTNAPGSLEPILERVVLAHETAHLWGLMCINYPLSADDQCDGSGHSKDSTSLMAPAPDWKTNSDVQNLILHPNEVNDLQGLASGRL